MEISVSALESSLSEIYDSIEYVASQGRYDDEYDKKYATIPEWINYIKNCDIVITNSFHGIVFAILFNKKFISIPLVDKEFIRMNQRITSLLSMLGLQNRLLKN